MTDSPQRMARFADFFRGYMGSAPMIAAALPIPVTAGKIIPTYAEHTSFLTAYTSMLCFLVVAFVFYRRHRIGTYMLPATWGKSSRIRGRFILSWTPMLCIIATVVSIIMYHYSLDVSLAKQTGDYASEQDAHIEWLLDTGTLRGWSWVFQATFFGSYFGIFIFSTLAFSLMAVREYMQTVLELSDKDLVQKSGDPAVEKIGD